MTAVECLQQCTIDGNIIKLPNVQLDPKEYAEVKKKLELIGGKWKGGKVYGFVFPSDPTEFLNSINNGNNRNLKKEYQFFATPAPLAKRLVELADPASYDEILEPSAGQGDIVNAISAHCRPTEVACYELMPINQQFLLKIPCVNFLGDDFLKHEGRTFDRIIANPPFTKNQDIQHIYKMWECLKEGGRIVTVASLHWKLSGNKVETDFRKWLDKHDAEIIELEGGEFKESGTNIKACIIILDK